MHHRFTAWRLLSLLVISFLVIRLTSGEAISTIKVFKRSMKWLKRSVRNYP